MKKLLPPILAVPIILLAVAFTYKKQETAKKNLLRQFELKRFTAIGCGSFINEEELDETYMPLLKGWGSYVFPITTSSDSAQIYFNQGISMYYAFHIIEALGSFKKAASFDPACAMAYWGLALSYGPNINDFGYSASPEALAANARALELAGPCTLKEKILIESIQGRYSADTTQTREYLNQRYADAMKAAAAKIQDADIATLYADALMVQHPWDLYDHDGQPKPWTPAIAGVLEQTLQMAPAHPGANHYYIHVVEGSSNPGRGLQAAKQLTGLMPGVSHIVHMPSHIYIRTGNYAEGEVVNEMALTGYEDYLKAYSPVVNAAFLYEMHNRHMLVSCANMEGRSKYAVETAAACQQSIDTSYMDAPGYFGTYSQYVWVTPLFTMVRFGKWDDILKFRDMGDKRVYASVILHFSRGLAYARKQLPAEARRELELMQKGMEDSVMEISASTFNPPIAGARVGERMLQGAIAEAEKNYAFATAYLSKAVELEDQMMYNEPKDWPLAARPYLGSTLLKAGKAAAAETIFRKDLAINPNNGWSLFGLWQSLIGQKKQPEAVQIKAAFDKAFTRADIKLQHAVF